MTDIKSLIDEANLGKGREGWREREGEMVERWRERGRGGEGGRERGRGRDGREMEGERVRGGVYHKYIHVHAIDTCTCVSVHTICTMCTLPTHVCYAKDPCTITKYVLCVCVQHKICMYMYTYMYNIHVHVPTCTCTCV